LKNSWFIFKNKIYRILLTISKLVAIDERNFLKLNFFKSYLKSTILQDRFNELVILSIESEVLELLDYKTLISDFVAKKTKRLI